MIECHSSASKSPWHDYVIHELKAKSLLFCLRYDPLIVFRRQNHIAFIFMKTMSHDLLVQMAYPSAQTAWRNIRYNEWSIFFTPVKVKYMEKNLVIANKFCQSLAWSFVIYIEVPPYQNEQFLTYYMIRVWRPRAAHHHQNFPWVPPPPPSPPSAGIVWNSRFRGFRETGWKEDPWGAFHLGKNPGNFGGSKSGISDW